MWARTTGSWRAAFAASGGASAALALFGYGSTSKESSPVSNFPKIQIVYPEKAAAGDVLVARRIVNERDKTGLGLRLYQYETCPFCCKVRAFLDYYGLSYEVVEVNPVTRAQIKFSKDYKKVPILKTEDDRVLTDSSLIVSQLSTFLTRPNRSLDEVLAFYPQFGDSKGADHPSRYFVMKEKEESAASMASAREEREWRAWVDDHFVHLISPNVYGTWTESVETFHWFEKVGEWHRTFPTWERLLAVYVGAAAMYLIAGRLKKKHGITDARESMKEACDAWAKALGQRRFLGGEKPNLADLALFGAMNSFRGCTAFKEVVEPSAIGPWYAHMTTAVKEHWGQALLDQRNSLQSKKAANAA